MRLIIIGCEYTGKTTLAGNVTPWIKEKMGVDWIGWHDHFMLPFLETTGELAEIEAAQVAAMTPTLMEKYSRYMIQYHFIPAFYRDNNHLLIDWYYADAVYAPLYYGYGGAGQYADRHMMARHWEAEVLELDPAIVLLLLKASPEVIRQRRDAHPHARSVLKDEHIEMVANRFQEEFDNSLIRRRITLDTTNSTPQQTFQEFLAAIEPHLSVADRLHFLTHQGMSKP